MSPLPWIVRIGPGLAVAVVISLIALALERLEIGLIGAPLVDGLVFAILLGTALHTIVGLDDRLGHGVQFAAKIILEIAIVLLGASISFASIAAAGVWLVATVVGVVFLALGASYGIGRMLGLSERMATLVACGNSICGNSAIVAAAPVINADSDEVAASIAFTAALGILVVLLLPVLASAFGLTEWQYGIFAGMTVYAVPQVLAATMPVGVFSTQVGALVKLMRVLMLGPVILILGLRSGAKTGAKLNFAHMVPWFIVGFLGMMTLRSFDLLPGAFLAPAHQISVFFTIVSMAALGLSVNLRTVLASGGRVLTAGILSLVVLGAFSMLTLHVLPGRTAQPSAPLALASTPALAER